MFGSLSLLRSTLFLSTFLGMVLPAHGPLGARELTANSKEPPLPLPTGVAITPWATPGAKVFPLGAQTAYGTPYEVGQPATVATSPDGKFLLLVTSGYNRLVVPEKTGPSVQKEEYIFLYDLSTPSNPKSLGVHRIPNSFYGACWSPGSDAFYVSGGKDDCVWVFQKGPKGWVPTGKIPLGHTQGKGPGELPPMVAGIAASPSGRYLLAANFASDSVSLVDLPKKAVRNELDLRPGQGKPGGEYPFWVVFASPEKAYVSSQRDREVLSLSLQGERLTIQKRIPVRGQPNRLLVSPEGRRLFVVEDNSDQVSVLDTATDQWIEAIPVPGRMYTPELPGKRAKKNAFLPGSNPTGLALSPDGGQLYVTCGAINAVALVELSRTSRDPAGFSCGPKPQGPGPHREASSRVRWLLPTGWYPSSVALSKEGSTLYITDLKKDPGPNPQAVQPSAREPKPVHLSGHYVWQLTKGDLLVLPIPPPAIKERLSYLVLKNNHAWPRPATPAKLLGFLRRRIHHLVYIIKENRTYDQILGDLEKGDGDRNLTLFPEPITPNHHSLARSFVTLDRFFDTGEVSGTGWNWSTAGRATEFTEKTVPVHYAGRGLSPDWEGENRRVNVGLSTFEERQRDFPGYPSDPDLLPGTRDVAAPDGPKGEEGEGYLWDAVLRAKKTLRNYGFFVSLSRYWLPPSHPAYIPILKEPFQAGIVQAYPTKKALEPCTDRYYRGFDMRNADYWLFKEWEREFDSFVQKGNLPDLLLVRLPHDHFGSFGQALFGVNTPETQMADNDYALGLLVEKIAQSPYAKDTLIVVIEDDAQDGPDHVHSHRSIALFAGPYVRHGVVVSTPYTTVDLLRTVFDLLGLEPSCQELACARFMADLFDPKERSWEYHARVPEILRSTELPLPKAPIGQASQPQILPKRTARYWEEATQGQDFTREDRLDAAQFNQALWYGLKGVAFDRAR